MADKQINPERALSEMVHWAQVNQGYIQLMFRGLNTPFRDVGGVEIPHPWLCALHSNQETHNAMGVTMEEAIVGCYRQWQGIAVDSDS